MTGNEAVRKCAALSPKESDALFFPGPGGKVNKARAFCSDCPFKNPCLINAVDNNLDGFWAGSTKDDRSEMAKLRDKVIGDLSDYVDGLLPKRPEPGRRIAKKKSLPPLHAWLDEIEPTDEELLALA